MIDESLNRRILKILDRVPELSESFLKDEAELAMGRNDLTTAEFQDAVKFLIRKGLVLTRVDSAGATKYLITNDGIAYLETGI